MQRMRLRKGIQPPGWSGRDMPLRRQLETGSHNLILPLRSYRYDQAQPLVCVGEEVRSGQALSKACGLLSRARIAPASGRVMAIENRSLANGNRVPCVVLRVHAPEEQALPPELALSAQGLESQQGLPLDHELDTLPDPAFLLINCAATERGHWSLHSLLAELDAHARLAPALELILSRKKFRKAWLAFHSAQEEPALALIETLKPLLELHPLKLDPTYPSAHPRLLARRLSELEADCKCTDPQRPLASQGLLCLHLDRLQLLQRRLHVGPADRFLLSWHKADGSGELLELPAGLPLSALTNAKGHQVFLGSLMAGSRAGSVDMPLLPPLRALSSLQPGQIPEIIEDACITCGLCIEACPQELAPPRLAHLIEEQRMEEARRMGLSHCLHCGICSFVCPSRIHLGHSLRKGQWLMQEARDD